MAERKPGGGTRFAASLSSIVRHFEALPDPRHQRNRRHLLVDVITIAVCGVIVGCSGPTAHPIRGWGRVARPSWDGAASTQRGTRSASFACPSGTDSGKGLRLSVHPVCRAWRAD